VPYHTDGQFYHATERKYYFAYHYTNGIPFAMMWAEDDGLCVGGRPDYIEGTKVEITSEEFSGGTSDLEKEHPFQEDIPIFLP